MTPRGIPLAGGVELPKFVQISPRVSNTGTLTLPSVPMPGSAIIVFEIGAKGIASVLPTGGGATWSQLAYLGTAGQSGGAIYLGSVTSTPSASIGVTASGNVADFIAVEFRNAIRTLDQNVSVGSSGGSPAIVSASVSPTTSGMGVFLHSSRGTSLIFATPRKWSYMAGQTWAYGSYSVGWGRTSIPSSQVKAWGPGSDCLLLATLRAP